MPRGCEGRHDQDAVDELAARALVLTGCVMLGQRESPGRCHSAHGAHGFGHVNRRCRRTPESPEAAPGARGLPEDCPALSSAPPPSTAPREPSDARALTLAT